MGGVFFGFSCYWNGSAIVLGGDRWSNYALSGYSEKAQCTGNTLAYLEPNRNTLQKPKRGRSLFAFFAAINSALPFDSIYMGGGRSRRATETSTSQKNVGDRGLRKPKQPITQTTSYALEHQNITRNHGNPAKTKLTNPI